VIGPSGTGAAAGAIADVIGSLAADIGALAIGKDAAAGAAGAVIVTGAGEAAGDGAVASTLCAMAGAEERARTAAIAVEPRRSGVLLVFIVWEQSSKRHIGPIFCDEMSIWSDNPFDNDNHGIQAICL
jgi:hypothetical protein